MTPTALPPADADTATTDLAGWWRHWVAGPSDRWVCFSLFVALLLLSSPSPRAEAVILWVLVIGVLLGVSLQWRIAPLAAIALFLAGVELRFAFFGVGFSDVLTATRAATEAMLVGGNPYAITSQPSIAPYPYGPLGLIWYLPTLAEPRVMEIGVAIAILALLAIRGRLLGLAIYSCAPVLLTLAGDGSNDTSAGLLLLGALVLIDRMPRVGAFVLGLAVAFKPYALAWAPPLVAYLGLPALLPLLVGAGIFWIPAFIAWGVGSIVEAIRMSDRVHGTPFYSLATALQRVGISVSRDEMNLLRVVAGAATALAVMRKVRTSRGVIIGGALIFVATLFSGFWSTYAYFAALAPIVCWHLDDWLDRTNARARWPSLIERLKEYVDKRWPSVESRTLSTDAVPSGGVAAEMAQ